MPTAWKTTLRTLASAAFGAGFGVIEQFIINAQMDMSHVDWHRAGMTAVGTAIVAVIGHWLKPPNTP